MRKRLLGVIVLLLVSGIVFYVWLGIVIDKGMQPKADGTNAYAIVLGAKVNKNGEPSLSLHYRLEEAVAYLEQYPHVIVIVSGGQGKEERILRESASTYENLAFSKKLLPEGETSVTIISSDFHLTRAQYLAEKIDLKVDVVPAKTPQSVEAKLRLRERATLLKTYLVGH